MALILINVILIMILNNIRKVLADQLITLSNVNIGGTVCNVQIILITQKVLIKKRFHYNILKKFRGKLQEYTTKNEEFLI